MEAWRKLEGSIGWIYEQIKTERALNPSMLEAAKTQPGNLGNLSEAKYHGWEKI